MSSSQASEYAPLPDIFRGGLTVWIVKGPCWLKSIAICCGISCAASFSLLCLLSYQTIKAKFSRDRERSIIQNNTPEGYFWLVQLFIAGILRPREPENLPFQTLFKVSLVSLLFAIWLPTLSSLDHIVPFKLSGLLVGLSALRFGHLWSLWILSYFLPVDEIRELGWLKRITRVGGDGLFVSLFGSLSFSVDCLDWSLSSLSGRIKAHIVWTLAVLGWPLDDQLGTGWCYIGQNYRWQSIFFTYGNTLYLSNYLTFLKHSCSLTWQPLRSSTVSSSFSSEYKQNASSKQVQQQTNKQPMTWQCQLEPNGKSDSVRQATT